MTIREKWIPKDIFELIRQWIPMPCIDIVIINNKNKILLMKRNKIPFINEWWIPGGKLKRTYGVTLEKIARKIVKEETGLDVDIIQQIGAFQYYSPEYYNESVLEEDLAVVFLAKTDREQRIIMESQHSSNQWVKGIPEYLNSQLKKVLVRAREEMTKYGAFP